MLHLVGQKCLVPPQPRGVTVNFGTTGSKLSAATEGRMQRVESSPAQEPIRQ